MIKCEESTYDAEIPTLGAIFVLYVYLLRRSSINFSGGTLVAGASLSSSPGTGKGAVMLGPCEGVTRGLGIGGMPGPHVFVTRSDGL